MDFLPHGSTPATAGFTCNSCGVRFAAADLQRQHMKTDWHRYNLKRRVAGLPLISSDVFASKVLSQQKIIDEALETEDEFGFHVYHRSRSSGHRQLTKKDLKHMAKADRGRLAAKATVESADKDTSRDASPAVSVALSLSEFSLGPDSDHFVSELDAETGSDMSYSDTEDSDYYRESDDERQPSSAGEETDVEEDMLDELPNYVCFYCGKNNTEKEANIKHMLNTHGLFIPERSYLVDLDGLLAFLHEVIVYDHECLTCGFEGKSLESIRQHMESKGHCRVPYETDSEKAVFDEFYDFSAVSESPSRATTTKKVAFADPSEADVSSKELTLPSGSKASHRDVARLQHRPALLLVPREIPDLTKTVALVDRRFAPGLTVRQVSKNEKDARRMEQKQRNIHQRRNKAAKVNFQPHFRDEILGT